MNNTEFIYWLQGMLEYTDINNLSGDQAKVLIQGIKDHLKLVMTKVTPQAGWDKNVLPKQGEESKNYWDSIRKSIDDKYGPPPQIPYQPYWLDKYMPVTSTDPSTWGPYRGKPGELVC